MSSLKTLLDRVGPAHRVGGGDAAQAAAQQPTGLPRYRSSSTHNANRGKVARHVETVVAS
jgi:hypothetical protein